MYSVLWNRFRRVTTLSIGHNSISGPVPPVFGSMVLDVCARTRACVISGSCIGVIVLIVKAGLEALDISSTRLSGKIPPMPLLLCRSKQKKVGCRRDPRQLCTFEGAPSSAQSWVVVEGSENASIRHPDLRPYIQTRTTIKRLHPHLHKHTNIDT